MGSFREFSKKMDLLSNTAKKLNSDNATETYFYWLCFGKAGYIGSKTFLGVLPWHDVVFNLFQMALFGQVIFFFYWGPMQKIFYFALLAIALNLIQIFAAIVFFARRGREILNGRGCVYW